MVKFDTFSDILIFSRLGFRGDTGL